MIGQDAEVVARLHLDSDGAVDGASNAARQIRRVGDESDGAQGKLSKLSRAFGAIVTAQALRQLADVAGLLFEVGSAAVETGSKFDTVMGPAAARVNARLREFANAAGLTQTEAKGLTATFASVAQGMGEAQGKSADLSAQALELAADFASFNNVPIEQAMNAITSATVGEREAMKALGVVLTEAEVKAAEATKEFEGQSRAAVTLELITRKAGVAVGDLARTSDSAANRSRALQAELRQVREEIAVALLPVFEDLLAVGVDLLPVIRDMANALTGTGEATTAAGEAVAMAVDDIRQLIDILTLAYRAADWLRESVNGLVPSIGNDLARAVRDAINPLGGLVEKLSQAARWLGIIKDQGVPAPENPNAFWGADLSSLDPLARARAVAEEGARLADTFRPSGAGVPSGGGGRSSDSGESAREKTAKEAERARREELDREYDFRRLKLEQMRDGLEKELAEIGLAFDERRERIRREYGELTKEEADLLSRLQAQREVAAQLAEFDGQAVAGAGPNASVRGGDAIMQAFDEAEKLKESLRDVSGTAVDTTQTAMERILALGIVHGEALRGVVAGMSDLFGSFAALADVQMTRLSNEMAGRRAAVQNQINQLPREAVQERERLEASLDAIEQEGYKRETELLKKRKKLATIQAVISTAAGVANALQTGGPFPFNLAAAAAVAAAGAAQIAAIQAQSVAPVTTGARSSDTSAASAASGASGSSGPVTSGLYLGGSGVASGLGSRQPPPAVSVTAQAGEVVNNLRIYLDGRDITRSVKVVSERRDRLGGPASDGVGRYE